jgi:hypothetical protein
VSILLPVGVQKEDAHLRNMACVIKEEPQDDSEGSSRACGSWPRSSAWEELQNLLREYYNIRIEWWRYGAPLSSAAADEADPTAKTFAVSPHAGARLL